MKAMEFDTDLAKFERQTCINPFFVADIVLHGVRVYYWVDLPAHLEQQLAERAVTVFTHNRSWRKKLLGERAPEFLMGFMRRWLAGLLCRQGHPLFRELPDSFKWGHPLPALSLAYQRQQQVPPEKVIRKRARAARPCGCLVHGYELLLP